MSGECGKCKPRFKGIERFLRRIAFSLGNTPSQTEIKIISCVPIDVADLQDKIKELEEELEKRDLERGTPRGQKSPNDPVVNAAHNTPNKLTPASSLSPPPSPPRSLAKGSRSSCECKDMPARRSAFAFTCAALDAPMPQQRHPCTDHRLSSFFKRPKKKRKNKHNTHLVYYTQAAPSPFASSGRAEQARPPRTRARRKSPRTSPVAHSYLDEMARKQFKPHHMAVEISDTSDFSTPVCRDESRPATTPAPRAAAGLCSCCHIAFHDIDLLPSAGYPSHSEYINVDQRWPAGPASAARLVYDGYVDVDRQRLPRDTVAVAYVEDEGEPPARDHSAYYDSSLYDLVPVREVPHDSPNNERSAQLERTQSRLQPHGAVYKAAQSVRGKKLYPPKATYKREPIKKMVRRKSEHKINAVISQSGSIVFGDVYRKSPPATNKSQNTSRLPTNIVVQRNAECCTIDVDHAERQAAVNKSVQLEPPPPPPQPAGEVRTEDTLNQIKRILQSVLTEVKGSAAAPQRCDTAAGVDTRDAVVQKGASRSSLAGCSGQLLGLAYGPYASHLGASGPPPPPPARPLPVPSAVYASQQKCLQNYPLFVHTTGRQCACCYRSVPGGGGGGSAPRRATAATNTEGARHAPRSQETEKLIKEIYKSIAIEMVHPPRNTSTGECDRDALGAWRRGPARGGGGGGGGGGMARGDVARPPVAAQDVRHAGANTGSDCASNAASVRSALTSSSTSQATRLRDAAVQPRRAPPTSSSESEPRHTANAATSPSDDESEPTTSEPDSDATVVDTRSKKKTGLFGKITRLFRAKGRKRKEKGAESGDGQGEGDSDSDDYQTVYSQRSRAPEPEPEPEPRGPRARRERPRYRRTHSKISTSRQVAAAGGGLGGRRSPYLEQEYRRYWSERLAFHGGDTPRYSSGTPPSPSEHSRPQRPPYYAEYHDRRLAVQPDAAGSGRTGRAGRASGSPGRPAPRPRPTGISWLHRGKRQAACCGRQWRDFVLDS